MYIPSNWTNKRTTPTTNGGLLTYLAKQHACGFTTTERLPGSNASMNATFHEQEEHESAGCEVTS